MTTSTNAPRPTPAPETRAQWFDRYYPKNSWICADCGAIEEKLTDLIFHQETLCTAH
jgi:hypothetical protein